MLEESLDRFNAYLRLRHYRQLFAAVRERSGSLTATEAFSAEVIYLLREPTIKEFADFLGISQPNATYKIAALIEKGYIVKNTSSADRRESRLIMTEKFRNYYQGEGGYIQRAVRDVESALTDEEARTLDILLKKILQKLERHE